MIIASNMAGSKKIIVNNDKHKQKATTNSSSMQRRALWRRQTLRARIDIIARCASTS